VLQKIGEYKLISSVVFQNLQLTLFGVPTGKHFVAIEMCKEKIVLKKNIDWKELKINGRYSDF
jgi:hypothetical protein